MMDGVSTSAFHEFRPQLLERRARLQALSESVSADDFNSLIADIDAALQRIDVGTYGLCEACHDPIEADRLEHDPLIRFCLAHLNPAEMRAHQQDLELASQIQAKLLPPPDVAFGIWDTHYRYNPLGAVGGDYCELLAQGAGESLFFAVGDVAGKGVAASLLMTHLSAIFRSLLSLDLPLAETMARANRLFCEGVSPSQYATVVCGRATPEGVELANAGHCRPLFIRRNGVEEIDSTGLPLGLFCGVAPSVMRIALDRGDSLICYTDGVTEAQNQAGEEYGCQRLTGVLRGLYGRDARSMTEGVLRDVALFRGGLPPSDDMTLLAVRRQ